MNEKIELPWYFRVVAAYLLTGYCC